MKQNSILFRHLLAAVMLLTGCHTAQKSTQSVSSNTGRNPCFIEDITLQGNSNCITLSPGKPSKTRQPHRIKPAEVTALQEKYGEMLGVSPQTLTNISLYSFVDEWMGVRYRMGGNDKKGIDCSAFVQRLYEQVFCVNLVRTAFEQFNYCSFVFDAGNLKEGDLVFFRTRGKRITHVGVYLANNYFVHASRTQGVMISSMNDVYWQRYFAGAGKIPVDDQG